MKIKIVEVIWNDALSEHGMWLEPKPIDPAHTQSVGFLICKDKKKICLAQTIGENGEVMNKFVIPKGCVISIKELIDK